MGLEQIDSNETIALWTSLFLRANLLGDSEANNFFYGEGENLDPRVSVLLPNKSIQEPNFLINILILGFLIFRTQKKLSK